MGSGKPTTLFAVQFQTVLLKSRPFEIAAHFRDQHPNEQYRCAQCNLGFNTHNDLDEHGGQTMHAAYRCRYPECGSECTRSR